MVAEAGARVQGSIEGLEPMFSTCSDARSSTTCCRRWAASVYRQSVVAAMPVFTCARTPHRSEA